MTKYIKVIFILLAAIAVSSCLQDDDSAERYDGRVEVRVGFSLSTPEKVTARSTTPGSEHENFVTRYEVFLFDGNGNLADHGENADAQTNPKLTVTPFAGSYTLCVIANHQRIGSGVGTITELRNAVLTESLIPEAGDNEGELALASPRIVMYGEKSVQLNSSPTATPVNVELRRAVSKLKFTLWNDLPTGDSYLIKKITLVNTLASSSVAEKQGHTTFTTRNPVEIYRDDTGMEPGAGNKYAPKAMYMFENRAGVFQTTNSDQKMKGANAASVASANGTNPAHLLIEGIYTTGASRSNVTQKVYLGHDNHKDFNVNRNELHEYRIRVTSADQTDTRVTVSAIPEIEFPETPAIQDAHYVMCPIKIKALNTGGDGWVLSSNQSWLTLRNDLRDLQKQGYWIDHADYKGTQSISGGDGEDITVYALMTENALGSSIREATLTLKTGDGGDAITTTLDMKQLPVNWAGAFGTERIEEYYNDNGYPWGFAWNRKVEYTFSGLFSPSWFALVATLYRWGGNTSVSVDYRVFVSYITIDYSKMNNGISATSKTNGQSNTWALHTGGAGTINELEKYLSSAKPPKSESGDFNSVEYYAAHMCMLKNKFDLEITKDGENTHHRPVIQESQVTWYLPAVEQFPFADNQYPLSQNDAYWSSTVKEGDKPSTAYTYTPASGQSHADRMSNRRVRCLRKK